VRFDSVFNKDNDDDDDYLVT